MTQTPPSDASSSDDAAASRAVDWEALIDEWAAYGHDAVKRFSERAKENVARARDKSYGRDEWLEDVKWFWQCVAEDAGRSVDVARETMRRQADDDTK